MHIRRNNRGIRRENDIYNVPLSGHEIHKFVFVRDIADVPIKGSNGEIINRMLNFHIICRPNKQPNLKQMYHAKYQQSQIRDH